MKTYKSVQEFSEELSKNEDLANAFKNDPVKAMGQVKINDKWMYRRALLFLGIIAVSVILGSLIHLFIQWQNYKADVAFPEFLVTIASTAVGAIAGLISQNT